VGTGIGQSVTRALLLLMQGRIEAQSRIGVGTTFCVAQPRV
jgi:signal transduction histidine kinase